MVTRRRGFTLIELLVVIAIIGILASMVFPVFARARESARKAVCLSNVKNIALAVQMYLGDNNDVFPPDEHGSAAWEFWNIQGQSRPWGVADPCFLADDANPYLRWPVILDEYVKNRSVYTCPSAKVESSTFFIVGAPDALSYWRGWEGSIGSELKGGSGFGPCSEAYPSGWGGDVTDTFAQMSYSTGRGTFAASIHFAQQSLKEVKHGALTDPVSTVVCADNGTRPPLEALGVAYPDVCALPCIYPGCNPISCWGEDSDNWPDPIPPIDGSAIGDASVRKQFARHLGGSNLGFADGHAAWIDSQRLLVEFVASAKGEPSSIGSKYLYSGCQPHFPASCGSDADCCPQLPSIWPQ